MIHELRSIAQATDDPTTETRLLTLIARLESASEPDEAREDDQRLAGLIVGTYRQDVAQRLLRRMAAGRAARRVEMTE